MSTPGEEGAVDCDVLIAGAGPAGLAVGACLRRKGIPCVMLEQGEHIAGSWHDHYERLRLHTSKSFSELPFLHYPDHYPRYPTRKQVIHYLEGYAREFDLEPRFSQHLRAAYPVDGGWEAQTQDTTYRASHLVVATGRNREPHRPEWSGQDAYRGDILHSSEYRDGESFAGQKVLVIGCGNSGGEIAIDLHEQGTQAAIAVRSPMHALPRDLLGVPIVALAVAESPLPPWLADTLNAPVLRAAMGNLERCGLNRPRNGPLAEIRSKGRVPLIDVGTVKLIRQGTIAVFPGVAEFTEKGVVFTDGRQEDFDAVILATGYRPRIEDFLDGVEPAMDEQGAPVVNGSGEAAPGLYFCGYRVVPTGILREIGKEARHVAAAIAADVQRKH